MNSQNNQDDELKRRERALQEREHALRLRELEAELNQPPISPTAKHQEPRGTLKTRYKQLVEVAKFVGIVVAVVIAVRIATWLATAVMIGGVAWIAYKLFFDGNRTKR